jgi:hypothetical protein
MIPLKTLVMCASLVTAVKSGWELSERIQKRRAEQDIESKLQSRLRRAYRAKLISGSDVDYWEGRIHAAKLDHNRKISHYHSELPVTDDSCGIEKYRQLLEGHPQK